MQKPLSMPIEPEIGQPPALAGEAERLRALHELKVLDTPPEAAFDDLAWLAAQLCDVPTALVTLVDGERQWFKARCGLSTTETARELAFCAHAIASDDVMEVPDAHLDPRFARNPLVTGEPHIRFYAGAPLVGREGHRFGTLCVIDSRPRSLTSTQHEGLVRLARRASEALEVRRQRFVAESRERTLALLLESMPDAVVTCDALGRLGEFNRVAREWHGLDPRGIPADEWADHFDLFDADGVHLLSPRQVPLLRAWKGEQVREAGITIRAAGQPPRRVVCNADPLLAADGRITGAVCVMHDVTRLLAAQAAAKVEAQRFAEAFSAAAQGMALVSIDSRWLDVNPALCTLLGHDRDALLQLDERSLTHPEDQNLALPLAAELLGGERSSYQLDKRFFHRSGRTVHAHVSVSLVRDAEGQPLHFVTQVQDLSQRHAAEARLRESEQRLRSVLENSHDAFVSVDDTQAIVEWNRAAEAAFGWRRSEVIGRPMVEVMVPPRLRGSHQQGMDRFMRTGEGHILDQRLQLPAWHRNGHEFMVEMTITAVHTGSRWVFNAFLHDITDRLASVERLHASEERLRTIADNVPALIGHVDAAQRYRFVNKPYAEWFGRTCDTVVGRHMSEVLPPSHYAAVRPRLQQVFKGETVVFNLDVVGADGMLRHMNTTYIPEHARAEDGSALPQVVGFHVMVHDLTAQTRLARVMEERALTDMLTGLPNRAAWTAELTRALARADRARSAVTVMFLDLDGFKKVNDEHGHGAGDVVLREFARRLRVTLRKSDFIARLAGDEFVVLVDRTLDAERNLEAIAKKVHQAMRPPVQHNGVALPLGVSLGAAVQHGPTYDATRLMARADEAMYAAKRAPDTHFAVLDC